jgi:hypothetical protein
MRFFAITLAGAGVRAAVGEIRDTRRALLGRQTVGDNAFRGACADNDVIVGIHVVPLRFDVARTVASGHQSALCVGDTRLHPQLVYRRHRGAQSRSVRFRRTKPPISQCRVSDGVDIAPSTLLCHRQFRIIARVEGRRCRTTGTVVAPLRRRADRRRAADHASRQPDRRGISRC